MDFSVSHLIHKIAMLIFLVLLILTPVFKNNTLVLVGIILLILDAIQFFIFFRCPFCKKHLHSSVDTCPHCGKKLN